MFLTCSSKEKRNRSYLIPPPPPPWQIYRTLKKSFGFSSDRWSVKEPAPFLLKQTKREDRRFGSQLKYLPLLPRWKRSPRVAGEKTARGGPRSRSECCRPKKKNSYQYGNLFFALGRKTINSRTEPANHPRHLITLFVVLTVDGHWRSVIIHLNPAFSVVDREYEARELRGLRSRDERREVRDGNAKRAGPVGARSSTIGNKTALTPSSFCS